MYNSEFSLFEHVGKIILYSRDKFFVLILQRHRVKCELCRNCFVGRFC